MWQERIQRYLLAGDAENDPDFRNEIRRISRIGLRVVGYVEIAVSVFMVTANLLLDPNPALVPYRVEMGALVVLIGLCTVAASRLPALAEHSRLCAGISGVASTVVLTSYFIRMTQFDPASSDFIPGYMTLIIFITVAAIPLRPVYTLLYGGLLQAVYVIVALAGREVFHVGPGVYVLNVVFILMLTLLATALSALLYDQRQSSWEWHNHVLQASEKLRQAETSNLLAQNAASVGRLAAALSHELNSPIGALVSGVDTLLLLASRQATCGGPDQQRMVLLQNELRKSIRESTDRLKEIVARMQRFTNLDQAEVQSADLNGILADVTALLEPTYRGRVKVELDLQPVPELVCRPQQLSAVFSSLLGNAIEATNGSAVVRVETRLEDSQVKVAIEDSGRGLDPEQVSNIFDPGFRVTRGRVSTGNWSMFSSRQIIREHGGDIEIASQPGQGTRVEIRLPAETAPLT